MKKRFEDDYKEYMQAQTPDLWDKIEAGLRDKPISAEPVPAVDKKRNTGKKKYYRYLPLAAAAVFMILVIPAALRVMGTGYKSEDQMSGGAAPENMEEAAPEETPMDNMSPDEDQGELTSNENADTAESGSELDNNSQTGNAAIGEECEKNKETLQDKSDREEMAADKESALMKEADVQIIEEMSAALADGDNKGDIVKYYKVLMVSSNKELTAGVSATFDKTLTIGESYKIRYEEGSREAACDIIITGLSQ